MIFVRASLVQQELIQNAEDAGASQVKFLHDEHRHGTSNLYHDGLKEFQVEFRGFQCRVMSDKNLP